MPDGGVGLSLVCPDLAALMGFCEDCYRLRTRIVWPYLTCYCQCNGVGVHALISLSRETGGTTARLGPWKMKMAASREEFEEKLPGRSEVGNPGLQVLFP
ncbi:MAG: hypothetical protein QM278_03390 [Pseudomonadota bacterium]|nr:hypothetical protein [Pseudomonadota bacterium]